MMPFANKITNVKTFNIAISDKKEEQILKSYHSKTQLHDTWMTSAISKLNEATQHKNDIEFIINLIKTEILKEIFFN